MGELLGIVIPLAAGAAISPAVITLQLITLSRSTAPLARGWAIAAGYAGVLAVETVIAFGLAAGTGGSGTPSRTEAAVKLAAAVALTLLGLRALRAAPKEDKPEPDSDRPKLGRYLVIGAALMATNITTTVLFIPAMHDIGTSDVAFAGKAVAAVLVFAITLVPAAGPPLAVTLLGDRAHAVLEALNGFTTRHRRAINAVICFGFAVFLAAVSLPVLL